MGFIQIYDVSPHVFTLLTSDVKQQEFTNHEDVIINTVRMGGHYRERLVLVVRSNVYF